LERRFDIIIVGGGVIGCAMARHFSMSAPNRSIALLEKEDVLAAHTSGRNSGVIHAGFNQKPTSLKAKFCVEGNRRLRAYCSNRRVKFEQCGTVVVAKNDAELGILEELEGRGMMNGTPGLRIVDQTGLHEVEPNASGEWALLAPTGSIVDSSGLVKAMAIEASSHGAKILTGLKVVACAETSEGITVRTKTGVFSCNLLINCGGLYADKIASMVGLAKNYRIIPFKGQYYRLKENLQGIIKSMIYPAPNLEFPFLGVHLTKRVNGNVILGPNAVIAPGREAYSLSNANPKEIFDMVAFPGLLRGATNIKFLKLILRELQIAMSKRRFLDLARALVPAISGNNVVIDTAGIRAQLMNTRGELVEDFLIEWGKHSIHILNSVSPGMTCSMPFADYVFNEAETRGYLQS
jgi:L-2-hydroxyglutarate oxidase LhgO